MFPSTAFRDLSIRARLSLLCLLTAAVLSNLFPITVPLVLIYLPASIFTYLILRLYGTTWAAVSAVASALVVPLSVGHPYAVIWYVFELVFVLWLCQRRKRDNLIAAVATYWILIGAPLVALSFYLLGAEAEVGLLISAKNFVNGITNATLACLLFQLLPLRQWLLNETEEQSFSLSQQLFSLLLGFLMVPAVVMLIGHLQGSISQMEARISQELTDKALSITGQPEPSTDIATNLTEFLNHLNKHLSGKETEQGIWNLTLLNQGRILVSNKPQYKQGARFNPGLNADITAIPGGAIHRLPHATRLFMPIAGRWRLSSYLKVIEIDQLLGWQLVVEKPVKPFIKELRWSAIRIFCLLTLLTYPALLLASWVSRRISAPLSALSQLTCGLPEKLQDEAAPLEWPKTRIKEINELNQNAAAMAGSLQLTFAEIRDAKQHLEERVRQRTMELHRANAALSENEQMLRDNQQRLNFLAHHDPLTGLANRLLFNDRLEHALAKAMRNGTQIALFFLDLDRFKNINDSLGHSCGDKLLQEVATRLNDCCRQSDTIARFGGDEFMVMIEKADDLGQITTLAKKILQQLSRSIDLCPNSLYITTSIGISIYPKDGHSVEELLKSADSAMYQAKQLGRNNYQFYTTDMASTAQELLQENI
ncbi:MAG TPA: GGDEF domain-containing protein [Malonomonas sp.]